MRFRPALGVDAQVRAHTQVRMPALIALVVAIAAGIVLVSLPAVQTPSPAASASVLTTLAKAWPRAVVSEMPATLADGTSFYPQFYLDTFTVIGTASSVDGAAMRLLSRTVTAGDPNGQIVEIQRVPTSLGPVFGAFAGDESSVVWVESVDTSAGGVRNEIWRLPRSGGEPALVTADTGEAVFFSSQYDLVLAGGLISWAAVSPRHVNVTEIRTVSVAGGPVAVRTVPGGWMMTASPWLVSAANGQSGLVSLRNLVSAQSVPVPTSPTEVATCSPAWCLVLVTGVNGPVRYDVMHPDGTARRRIASAGANPAVFDVGILDRFEVLNVPLSTSEVIGNQQLQLYDHSSGRTVAVADGIEIVYCMGGMLYWSTGSAETEAWHALDLRTLS